MTKTIDALEKILAVERTAINDSDAWTEIKWIARAALAQARAEQAEPLESVCATCGALRVDPVLEVAAPAPNLEPCGVVESAAYGCEGYHVRMWPGQPTPRIGAKLYTTPPAAPAPKLEPLTHEEIKKMWKEYAPIIGGIFDFTRAVEAAHNAKLTESQRR